MKPIMMTVAVTVTSMALTAGSLLAATLNPQPEPPGVRAPNTQTESIVSPRDPQVSLPTPAAVGKCKSDDALKQ
jgi:hypothetical protein